MSINERTLTAVKMAVMTRMASTGFDHEVRLSEAASEVADELSVCLTLRLMMEDTAGIHYFEPDRAWDRWRAAFPQWLRRLTGQPRMRMVHVPFKAVYPEWRPLSRCGTVRFIEAQ